MKPALRSQYICLKISVNRHFDPFYRHLYVMYKLVPFLAKFGVKDVTKRK